MRAQMDIPSAMSASRVALAQDASLVVHALSQTVRPRSSRTRATAHQHACVKCLISKSQHAREGAAEASRSDGAPPQRSSAASRRMPAARRQCCACKSPRHGQEDWCASWAPERKNERGCDEAME